MTSSDFIALQLPPANLEITEIKKELFVYDIVRKKQIKLEPEEWVRQHLLHYLITHLNYPLGLIQLEVPVEVNKLRQRADILVYSSRARPFLLVECKAYDIPMGKEVLQQAIRYNKTLKSEHILISNGLEHHCFKRKETGELIVLQEFPDYAKNE